MILVAILSVIILGLVGYIAYDKISEANEDKVVDNNKEESNEVDNNEISAYLQTFYSKLSGKYSAGKKLVDNTGEFAGTDYADLELKNDGTGSLTICANGGGCSASISGKYVIEDESIFLIDDDECNVICVEGDCFTVNCNKIEEIKYKEDSNGNFVLYVESNGVITEFEKR